MNKKRIFIGVMLVTIMTVFVPNSKEIYANNHVHKTIRVGLRSAYNNVRSIDVKNNSLDIGYGENDLFKKVDTLNSSSGYKIIPSSGSYYETNQLFSTYRQAELALASYTNQKVIIGYVYPDMWTIYSAESQAGEKGKISFSQGIEVQDGSGNTILIADYEKGIPAFTGSFTKIGKTEYRGWFEFIRKSNLLTAVNTVDVEEYLYGVVPAEMPPSWDMEALKAQAVAARSMAMYQYNKYKNDGYNVCDTVYTQVYRGYTGESARTNQAVNSTRGQVVTYNNKLAETVFYSTSGGYTEDPKHVWGNTVAYLKSVPDPYETDPEMKPWTRTITLEDIDKSLSRDKANIGQAKGMKINSYTPAGRVNELEIIGSLGSHKLTREKIRTFFSPAKGGSLRSRMFTIEDGQTTVRPGIIANDTVSINAEKYINILDMYILNSERVNKNHASNIVVAGAENTVSYEVGGSAESGQVAKYGDIVLSGKGYGHGVGMSQSGAKGMAMQGYNYEDIIKYYYQGVEVTK